jgi:hypothetical protein
MEEIVRRWRWILFWPVSLMTGCVTVPTAPPPPIDAAAPAKTETATFGLG